MYVGLHVVPEPEVWC